MVKIIHEVNRRYLIEKEIKDNKIIKVSVFRYKFIVNIFSKLIDEENIKLEMRFVNGETYETKMSHDQFNFFITNYLSYIDKTVHDILDLY